MRYPYGVPSFSSLSGLSFLVYEVSIVQIMYVVIAVMMNVFESLLQISVVSDVFISYPKFGIYWWVCCLFI